MIADCPSDPAIHNNLLRALRPDDLALIMPKLSSGVWAAGAILYEPGDNVHTVYLPAERSLVAFAIPLHDGRGVETALIGREGAVGGIVSNGRLPAYARCRVQFPGPYYAISSADLEAAKVESLSLRHLFSRYADCVVAQIFQSVACNAAHSIEQRTARWLLAAIDRVGEHEVPLTQEQLASMLGVGRSYVSRVIRALRERGVLSVRRGHIVVASVEGLEAAACECNVDVRRHFDTVLSGVYPKEVEQAAA